MSDLNHKERKLCRECEDHKENQSCKDSISEELIKEIDK
jgi:hypothetical protein